MCATALAISKLTPKNVKQVLFATSTGLPTFAHCKLCGCVKIHPPPLELTTKHARPAAPSVGSPLVQASPPPGTGMANRDTIVVGASAGGVQTLSTLVAQLPSEHSSLLRKLLLSDQKDDIGDELIQVGNE